VVTKGFQDLNIPTTLVVGFRGPTDIIVGRLMHFLLFYSRSSADRS